MCMCFLTLMQIGIDKAVKIYNSLPSPNIYQKRWIVRQYLSHAGIYFTRAHTSIANPSNKTYFLSKAHRIIFRLFKFKPSWAICMRAKLLPCAAPVVFSMQMRMFILQNLLS